ncbi:MAG TPA: DUF4249 family protein [Taishania sp.]|nr:DUF4249 family protein [Taishania sp.]
MERLQFSMKKLFGIKLCLILFLLIVFSACEKEVEIDLPGFKEQLVVDGSIETGMPPIVILSKSKNIYSPTNLQAFVNSFVTNARVFVNDGTIEVELDLICSNNLPPEANDYIAGLLGVDLEQLADLNICAFTSFNPAIWGEVGKTYTLRIEHEGNVYSGVTSILTPVPLSQLWFQQENSTPGYGYSHAILTDPAGTYDAYQWEVKRINMVNGKTKDAYFKPTFNSAVDDMFFDGKTFEFYYENPWMTGYGMDSIPSEQRAKYAIGDTVVIKFSKIDKGTFDFLYTKTMQQMSSGNPFASSLNVKSNLTGGCLGVWAGYSPTYDTMICQ